MEFVKENEFGRFSVVIDNKTVVFSAKNCKVPVRMYVCSNICEYAGIAEGDEILCVLRYVCRARPESIIITDGRIDDTHNILCEFKVDNKHEIASFFSLPCLVECLRFYGHFLLFNIGECRICGVPSDFFIHPVLELIEYSYWYSADCGLGCHGYYFFGYNMFAEPYFIDKNILVDLIKNYRMFRPE